MSPPGPRRPAWVQDIALSASAETASLPSHPADPGDGSRRRCCRRRLPRCGGRSPREYRGVSGRLNCGLCGGRCTGCRCPSGVAAPEPAPPPEEAPEGSGGLGHIAPPSGGSPLAPQSPPPAVAGPRAAAGAESADPGAAAPGMRREGGRPRKGRRGSGWPSCSLGCCRCGRRRGRRARARARAEKSLPGPRPRPSLGWSLRPACSSFAIASPHPSPGWMRPTGPSQLQAALKQNGATQLVRCYPRPNEQYC